MTDAEWLAATDPRKMVEYLRRKTTDRKLRLFACEFWCWDGMQRNGSDSGLSQALLYVEVWAETGIRPDLPFPEGFGWHPLLATDAHSSANWTIRNKRGYFQGDHLHAENVQLNLLRDIFGNPFHPVAFDPNWRTSDVAAMARGMYETRDFAAMPILADALQDAGCEHADVLEHCRGPGPHVRGCWVVDLILGKE